MKNDNLFIRGNRRFLPFSFVSILINRLNHYIGAGHLKKYPQMAIFSFDHIGYVINFDGIYEKSSLELVESFLKKNVGNKFESALDVGANIGNHSMFFSRIYKNIYSFECNPRTFKLLEFNSFGHNIFPLDFALSDKNETLNFVASRQNVGGSNIVDSVASFNPNDCLKINAKKLDDIDLFDDVEISLIKIDVEGYELKVLEGARNTIIKNNPVILFEQSIFDIKSGSSKCIDYLRELGYKFYAISENFYFGEGLFMKALSFFVRSIFGFQKNIVQISFLKKNFMT